MIALPFEGHDRNWEERSRKRMAFLIQHSSETVSTGQKDAPPAANYRRRNEYMVDHAGCLLAVYAACWRSMTTTAPFEAEQE